MRGSAKKRVSSGRRPWPIPAGVTEYIKDSLEANAFYSLRDWCHRIKKEFGF